ncbi:MAG: hypothetical protein KMY55_09190 [Dethiosulfatibacter sp.]|nr:hypothetical protein [Dethiosulfatibacter sp.]
MNEKLKSTQQTPANNSDPKMSIKVSRARTTVVDSAYWTVETIRTGEGLGDVSVTPRRFKSYGHPNRLYEIHVHNNEVNTAIREYPDKLKDGWKDQFTLGPGSSVAIAFNGHWERYRKLWRLITDEKPWIFWVDDTGILWRQYWDDETTKFELATNVSCVRAIRAWKNVNVIESDQGIVVGYVKTDGTVCYRNYCQQEDYTYVWEGERQLTQFTDTAVHLNMFITNDYRMGFAIESSTGQVHWLITPRNWAGMAVEQHTITTNITSSTDLLKVSYYDVFHDETIITNFLTSCALLFGRTDNSIVTLENLPMTRLNEQDEEYQDWGFIIRITLNYFAVNVPTVVLMDTEWNAPIPVANVVEVNGSKGFQFDVYIDEAGAEFGMNTVQQLVAVEITDSWNEAGYLFDTMNDSFMPLNLIFPDLPLPTVEVIWNE